MLLLNIDSEIKIDSFSNSLYIPASVTSTPVPGFRQLQKVQWQPHWKERLNLNTSTCNLKHWCAIQVTKMKIFRISVGDKINTKTPPRRVLHSFEPANAGREPPRGSALAEAYRITSVILDPI